VPARVEVAGDRIRLGDLAPVAKDVAGLDLGRAPRPGKSRRLLRRDVRARLRRAMVATRGLRMPKRIVVHRASQVLNELQVEHLVGESLASQLPPEFEIEGFEIRGGVVLPVGNVLVDLELPRRLRSGRQTVVAWLGAGSSKPERVMVNAKLRRTRNLGSAVIERGDAVNIVLRGQGIVIRAKAVAQQGGRIGQTIAVLPSDGRKVVRARILNNQLVEVGI